MPMRGLILFALAPQE